MEGQTRPARLFEVAVRLEGHRGGVLCCAFSPSGAYVLSGAQDRCVGLWNAASGRRVAQLDGHGQGVRAVQCSLDSARVLSVGEDKQLLV